MFHVCNITTIISLANERKRITNIAVKHRHIEVNLKFVSWVPLSALPGFHVADESNMVAAKIEIYHYPGNARSKLWEYFGFYQLKEGLKGEKYMEYLNR